MPGLYVSLDSLSHPDHTQARTLDPGTGKDTGSRPAMSVRFVPEQERTLDPDHTQDPGAGKDTGSSVLSCSCASMAASDVDANLTDRGWQADDTNSTLAF